MHERFGRLIVAFLTSTMLVGHAQAQETTDAATAVVSSPNVPEAARILENIKANTRQTFLDCLAKAQRLQDCVPLQVGVTPVIRQYSLGFAVGGGVDDGGGFVGGGGLDGGSAFDNPFGNDDGPWDPEGGWQPWVTGPIGNPIDPTQPIFGGGSTSGDIGACAAVDPMEGYVCVPTPGGFVIVPVGAGGLPTGRGYGMGLGLNGSDLEIKPTGKQFEFVAAPVTTWGQGLQLKLLEVRPE